MRGDGAGSKSRHGDLVSKLCKESEREEMGVALKRWEEERVVGFIYKFMRKAYK